MTDVRDILAKNRSEPEDIELKELLSEREYTHGDFKVVAGIAQGIKKAMRDDGPSRVLGYETNWDATLPIMREALDAIAVKMARIIAGNGWHKDHWRDIQGYAQLVLDWIERERGR